MGRTERSILFFMDFICCHNNSPSCLRIHLWRNSGPHSNRRGLEWFAIQHLCTHRGLEPCLMCGCCVSLWPQTVWRATVTESQGQGEEGGGRGQHLMGGKGPCLGVQDPDSPRRLAKQTQCSERTPLDPHIHALFVPTHLCETSDA